MQGRTTQPGAVRLRGRGASAGDRRWGTDAQVDADDNAAVDGSLQHYGGLRAYVAGTQHLDFTDQTLVSPIQRLTHTGPIKGARVREITRGLVLGFFDQELKGKGNVPAFAEVRMERFGG